MGTAVCEPCKEVHEVLARLVPGGRPFPRLTTPLQPDECRWFLAAIDAGVVTLQPCGARCSRLRSRGATGSDEFLNPRGAERHLFSSPDKPQPTFNREYLPHIAAHARAVLALGYNGLRADFSQYFAFRKSSITKKAGQRYELDSLFYDSADRPFLHIEVKAKPRDVQRIADGIDAFHALDKMPEHVAKEVEYVLELAPSFLWLVGPGTVDPEAHVWRVLAEDSHVTFFRELRVPSPHIGTDRGTAVPQTPGQMPSPSAPAGGAKSP